MTKFYILLTLYLLQFQLLNIYQLNNFEYENEQRESG